MFGENYVINSGNNGNKLKEIELFNKFKEIREVIDKFVRNGNGVISLFFGLLNGE